jgi:hypothetical protein
MLDLDETKDEGLDPDKYIWNDDELKKINRKREKVNEIPVIKRDPKSPYGIRAHPEMSFGKCILSIFRPDSNEFIAIWLFIIFAIYMWV